MNKIVVGIMGLFLVLGIVSVVPTAFADENEVVALKGEVNDLTNKVDSLERLVTTMQGHITPTKAGAGTYVPSGQETPGGLLHTLEDIHMGGYADVQFNQNFIEETSNVGGNPLRTFDSAQNTFSLNAFELDFQKTANPEGGAGFRFDIAMGENIQVVDTGTTGTDADEFGLSQAYIELVAPLKFIEGNGIIGDTVNIKAGRLATLAGVEVFRAPDNWNISRSFLYGLAEPVTHTGVRAELKVWEDKVTTWWGLNNGWNNVIDNNIWKTLESGFTTNLMENVAWTSSFLFGPENAVQTGHKRFFMSHVLGWDITDQLSFKTGLDFGTQRRVVGLQGAGFKNAQWWGMPFYFRYQATSKFALANRFEFFRDEQTFRTGLAGAAADSLWEDTITAEYQIYDNLTGRLEYRFDHANSYKPFHQHSSQSILGAELIYNFS